MAHVTRASITFDEGPHLAIGYATLRTGDFRLQPVHIHPPLANVLAAAPLLLQSDLPDPRAIDGWEIASLSAISDAVVWQYPEPARIATAGRVPILLLSVLLGTLIYRWAKDLGGWRAGLLALALYTFDPNCIAHGSVITTDMAAVFFIVATLYLTNCELRIANCELRSITRFVAIGVLMGLAQLTKVSALLLAPVVGFLLLLQSSYELRITHHASRITFYVLRFTFYVLRTWAIVFGVAALVVWVGYGFEIASVPGFPFPLPAGTHIRIFQSLREHYDVGHPTFLLGQVSSHGWWWYFPVAFTLKTPLPVLFLALWAVLRWRFQVSSFKFQVLSTMQRMLPLILFPLLYAASSLFSSVNIGYRHLLPLLPFLYVGIGAQVGSKEYGVWSKWYTSRITRHVSRFAFYVLLVWLIVGTLALSPHFLTFFNEIAGGARGGYRYLVDSNLDWGQNLWDLRQWMTENGEDHVYYAHYSPARPEAYGIDADFLPPDPRAVVFAPWNPSPGLYAIGATVLQGPYAPDVNTYAWFHAREPVTRLGNALFVYEVAAMSPPAWAVLCADTGLTADTLRAQLGLPILRVLQPDCAQAQVYPEGAGISVVPSSYPQPAGTRDFVLRTANGRDSAAVYRIVGAPTPDVAYPVATAGPLDFIGYSVTEAPEKAELTLLTYWRVKTHPGRLVSLMAHLIAPDGTTVAVGDGMGHPLDQWHPGDIIVQQHHFPRPDKTRYTFRIGGYWLDTLERWMVEGGGDYWDVGK